MLTTELERVEERFLEIVGGLGAAGPIRAKLDLGGRRVLLGKRTSSRGMTRMVLATAVSTGRNGSPLGGLRFEPRSCIWGGY
ncbi:hypothetical protein [Allosalinactinospora lopnorensis]|uniref:hypothetical protein n=1 Tax=Allosalinactinospora lopnorensis TaxID=1352348 RepID=UPI00138F53D3|nr:hypothetical protein [Allosalinactinospora lopnorensis]